MCVERRFQVFERFHCDLSGIWMHPSAGIARYPFGSLFADPDHLPVSGMSTGQPWLTIAPHQTIGDLSINPQTRLYTIRGPCTLGFQQSCLAQRIDRCTPSLNRRLSMADLAPSLRLDAIWNRALPNTPPRWRRHSMTQSVFVRRRASPLCSQTAG